MAVTDEPSARSASAGMKRKEDPRFIRGQGNYVDDVKLPGMLHGAALRSPLAHARIVSIDTSAALQHPKVRAVITGKDLEGAGARLDADAVGRHAGRARHRQGPLPGPGGRVRRRRRPLRRARRARADRRRVRAAARGRRPAPRARRRRAGHPRRQGGQDRQPHLRLGGRRRGGDRRACSRTPTSWSSRRRSRSSACTRRRWRRAARWPTSTRSPASCGCGARRRRRTRTARCTRSWPGCPSTRSR